MMWCVCTDVLTHVCIWMQVLTGLFRSMTIFMCKIELVQSDEGLYREKIMQAARDLQIQ